MKYLLILSMLFIFGCGNPYPKGENPITLVRSINISPNWDSVYIYSDGHLVMTENSKRYFLISYATRLENDNSSDIKGSMSFACTGFPNKGEIDSFVYSGLIHKKSCYQDIVILSIFEFKSEADYLAYAVGWKTKNKPSKHKLKCQ